MGHLRTLLAALLLLSIAHSAHASPSDDARRLYQSGTKHFDLAEYDQALQDFKEGYRQHDDPVFLYNIAQCYRLLNKPQDAITFYRSYLRRAPQAPNRDEVDRKIATLEEAVRNLDQARNTPPQATLQPEPTPATSTPASNLSEPPPAPVTADNAVATTAQPAQPLYKKWWLWTGVGVVVVAVGLGVGLGVGLSHGSSGSTFTPVTF